MTIFSRRQGIAGPWTLVFPGDKAFAETTGHLAIEK